MASDVKETKSLVRDREKFILVNRDTPLYGREQQKWKNKINITKIFIKKKLENN